MGQLGVRATLLVRPSLAIANVYTQLRNDRGAEKKATIFGERVFLSVCCSLFE